MRIYLLAIFTIATSVLCYSEEAPQPSPVLSLVRVNMTAQPTYFFQPWDKKNPSTQRGLGAVLEGDRVLTVAKFIADASYIELEHPVTAEKIPARVEVIDYEANLAILKPETAMFDDRVPLQLSTSVAPGDTVSVWQVENNGTPLVIDGTVSRAEISSSFIEGRFFLEYEVSGLMQFRGSSATVPVIKDNQLIGLLVTYSSKEQMSEVIAGPIIKHFLDDIQDGDYQGFPQFGILFSQTEDEQFRRYLQLQPESGGIYVRSVLQGQSAQLEGIEKGDVILSIGDFPIDSRGYYTHPIYGKLSYLHLVTSKPKIGEQIPTTIIRDGKEKVINVKLTRRPPDKDFIDSYMFDRGPKYIVQGGLVFQELTRTYLEMYGKDWRRRAPFKLVYADQNPDRTTDRDDLEKLVFLSRVIPANSNVGYENLSHLVVTKVNGTEIKSIIDLDRAFESPEQGIHRIEFESFPSIIFLDADEVEKTNQQLQTDYGIHTLKVLK